MLTTNLNHLVSLNVDDLIDCFNIVECDFIVLYIIDLIIYDN